MHAARFTAVASTLLLAGGCSFSLNDPADHAPRLYVGGTYQDSAAVTHVLLSWWYPPGDANSFTLYVQDGAGRTFSSQYDGKVTEARLDLDATWPGGNLTARLEAQPSGGESNTVGFQRPVLTPQVTVTRVATGFKVDDAVSGELVDSIQLWRSIVQGDGTASRPVLVATGTSAANVFIDTDLSGWSDGAAYSYQANAVSGGVTGEAGTAASIAAPFVPPRILSFTASNTSSGQTETVDFAIDSPHVLRAEVWAQPQYSQESLIGVVQKPPQGQALRVSTTNPGVCFSKICRVRVAAVGASGSTQSTVRWFPMTTGGDGFAWKVTDVAPGTRVARTDTGAFAVLNSGAAGSSLTAPGDDGTHSFPLPAGVPAQGPQLDSQGHPHAVYAEAVGAAAAAGPVLHAWHDGAAWNTETIAQGLLLSQPALALGADGVLTAAWVEQDSSVHVARQSGGAWAVTAPALSSGAPPLVAADEAGFVHLVIGPAGALPTHAWQDASGWHQESLPNLSASNPGPYSAHAPQWLAARAGRVIVSDQTTDSFGFLYCALTVRDASGWGPYRFFEQVTFPPIDCRTALSADGRYLVTARFDSTVRYDLQANTSGALSFYLSLGTPAGVGFSPSGKEWVLEYIYDSDGAGHSVIPPFGNGTAVLIEQQ